MTLVSPSQSNPNDTIEAADINNPINQLAAVINGGIDSNNLTDGSLVTADLADGSITPAKLVAGTGTTWTPASVAPTWTNLTVGNGTVVAKQVQIGKLVYYTVYLLWGTTTSVSGSVSVSLPVTSIAVNGVGDQIGTCKLWDGTQAWNGPLAHGSTTTGVVRWSQVQSTGIKDSNISSTSPATWSTGSEFHIMAIYTAA